MEKHNVSFACGPEVWTKSHGKPDIMGSLMSWEAR